MKAMRTDDRAPVGPILEPARGRRFARWPLVSGVLVVITAAVLAIAALLVWSSDDDTTAPPTATDPTAGTADTTVVWPFPGGTIRFATPEAAARSFATEFLRFQAPVLEPFEAGDNRSGEIPLRPAGRGPVTTVLLRQVGPGDDWSVLGAVSDNIEVTEPEPFTEVSSPVRVAGRSVAFEGTWQVEVRADGGLGALGSGFVTGGGDVLRPFEGTVEFETPGAPYGVLVFFTESAENGQVWEATTLRVALRSTDIDAAACGGYRSPRLQPALGQMAVKAYVVCDVEDGALRPVYRLVPESPQVLRASLDALLAGLTEAERDASHSSWFSAETAGMLRAVTIDDAGHAAVDFDDLRPVIPNASSSAGSARLLAQLDATVFQFRGVESVEYRIEGSCEVFNEWLQYGGCTSSTRPAATD